MSNRSQMTEDRSQKTDDRKQRTDDGRQITELDNRGQISRFSVPYIIFN